MMLNQLFKRSFHLLANTLLSLLLPLSFLLLSTLWCSQYLQALVPISTPQPVSFFSSAILSVNPVILFSLISPLTIATLLHSLLGIFSKSSSPISQLHLSAAWAVLCLLQISVSLGIEGITTIITVDATSFGLHRSLWCRLLLCLGLHSTMLHWSRAAVKPVVDNTVFGVAVEENWVERAAMAVSFGNLWWLRLRNEADSLVIVVERKMKLLMDISVTDFAGWSLYYLIVAVGFVEILKSVAWFVKVLVCKRKEGKSSQFCQSKGIDQV